MVNKVGRVSLGYWLLVWCLTSFWAWELGASRGSNPNHTVSCHSAARSHLNAGWTRWLLSTLSTAAPTKSTRQNLQRGPTLHNYGKSSNGKYREVQVPEF